MMSYARKKNSKFIFKIHAFYISKCVKLTNHLLSGREGEVEVDIDSI